MASCRERTACQKNFRFENLCGESVETRSRPGSEPSSNLGLRSSFSRGKIAGVSAAGCNTGSSASPFRGAHWGRAGRVFPMGLGAAEVGKLPSFQFYPKDYLADPELSRCSLAARGVWMDLLCIMFQCEERGVLSTSGRAWSDREIAGCVRGSLPEVLSCLRELVLNGVANRTASGALFSKRMVRDEHERKQWREQQKRHRLGLRSGCQASVRPMSRSSASAPPNLKPTPLPPARGGQESFSWCGETVVVEMGAKRRLPKLDAYQGARAMDVVEFLNRQGFPAKIGRPA